MTSWPWPCPWPWEIKLNTAECFEIRISPRQHRPSPLLSVVPLSIVVPCSTYLYQVTSPRDSSHNICWRQHCSQKFIWVFPPFLFLQFSLIFFAIFCLFLFFLTTFSPSFPSLQSSAQSANWFGECSFPGGVWGRVFAKNVCLVYFEPWKLFRWS